MNDPEFGFQSTNAVIQEYQSSINVDPLFIPLEELSADVARNLAYRAEKLIECHGWKDQPVSVVFTLTVAPGEKVFSNMSLQQAYPSSHQDIV